MAVIDVQGSGGQHVVLFFVRVSTSLLYELLRCAATELTPNIPNLQVTVEDAEPKQEQCDYSDRYSYHQRDDECGASGAAGLHREVYDGLDHEHRQGGEGNTQEPRKILVISFA